jgi:hypothetical protein
MIHSAMAFPDHKVCWGLRDFEIERKSVTGCFKLNDFKQIHRYHRLRYLRS